LESAVNALREALQWLLGAFEIWLRCAAKPVPTLNRVLLEVTGEEHLSAAEKIWVPSLLISLIVSFPVLKLYGIEWNNVGYHLCTLATTIAGLVVNAFVIHRLLLALKLKSEFVHTLVIYTVILTTYAPVSNLFSIPSALSLFSAVQDFKQHPIGVDEAVIAYFHNLRNTASIASNVFGIASVLLQVFSIAILALFAESLSQWYGNDRFKCYSAVAASMLLSVIVVLLVISPMQILIIYAFVSAAPS
jgi:hypothetical protein